MEQKVNLELTIQQINIVLAAIVKLPIDVGLETFNVIQQQANAQLGQPTNVEGPLASKVTN